MRSDALASALRARGDAVLPRLRRAAAGAEAPDDPEHPIRKTNLKKDQANSVHWEQTAGSLVPPEADLLFCNPIRFGDEVSLDEERQSVVFVEDTDSGMVCGVGVPSTPPSP